MTVRVQTADFDVGAGTSTAYYEAFFNRRESESISGHRQFFPFVEGRTYLSGLEDPADLIADLAAGFVRLVAQALGS